MLSASFLCSWAHIPQFDSSVSSLEHPTSPPPATPIPRLDGYVIKPNQLHRGPCPTLHPWLCASLSSPPRRECLFFWRLHPLTSLSALIRGKPVVAFGSFLSITFEWFPPFFLSKTNNNKLPYMQHPSRKRKFYLIPLSAFLTRALSSLDTSPHVGFAVSLYCSVAPTFLNVQPTPSTTISLSKATGAFLVAVPQPVLLSVCIFNTAVFLSQPWHCSSQDFYSSTSSCSSCLAVWRLFLAILPFWKRRHSILFKDMEFKAINSWSNLQH